MVETQGCFKEYCEVRWDKYILFDGDVAVDSQQAVETCCGYLSKKGMMQMMHQQDMSVSLHGLGELNVKKLARRCLQLSR